MSTFSHTIRRLKEMYIYRHEPEYLRPLAEVFWRTLLACVVAGMVGLLVFAASVFLDVITTLGSASGGPARQPAVLDRATLQDTLRKIDERHREFEAKKIAPTLVVDPSR